jgi:hypothetical protein
VGKPEGKRRLGWPRQRWEYQMRMDLGEISWGVVLIQLAQDSYRWRPFMNAVMNFRVHGIYVLDTLKIRRGYN